MLIELIGAEVNPGFIIFGFWVLSISTLHKTRSLFCIHSDNDVIRLHFLFLELKFSL